MMTDLGNARRLVRSWGLDLRYVHAWRTWLADLGTQALAQGRQRLGRSKGQGHGRGDVRRGRPYQ
jgi:hypothetical protein